MIILTMLFIFLAFIKTSKNENKIALQLQSVISKLENLLLQKGNANWLQGQGNQKTNF